ncbi:hypothetical protein DPMN_052956 [Dreissena polymorpha]|uniref:Uncharacterized protein n=1 Tax=Dreissena polymorpha TaxID=45954 RepID=A0A9D4HQ81_DREPO|nr:hypothetical protein DPMN_052956 [Dreissena polymorpha]
MQGPPITDRKCSTEDHPFYSCLQIAILRKFHYGQNVTSTRVFTRDLNFHEDRKINVASRVLTKKNAPPHGSHVFQPTGIIFEPFHEDRTVNVASNPYNAKCLGSHTNLLTKFHEDWTMNVASRVLTRKNAPPLVAIGTNLTKFHDDRKINVTSRVLTRKNAPPRSGHVFQPTGIIFERVQDIFHEDRTINEKCPTLGSHVFQANVIIFELIQDINKTNLLTKFHEDWTINVPSRVLTRKNAPPPGGHFHEDRKINVASRVLTRKNAPPPGGHVFQPTGIIFELVQDIIGMNLLTKFHEDWTINVASRVLTRFYYSHIWPYKENAPPLGRHVFQAKVTIFELIQDIIVIHLLSKFHEDRKINVASRVLTRKNAPPPGGHVFQPTSIILELVQNIIRMNLLFKFHEDQTINVASSVKNAPPLVSHVFQANIAIFELIQDIIETNLLTKFHEDWTINVASSELTRQMLTPHISKRTKGDHKSSP